MDELEFRYVTRQVETSQFDCGIDSINEYIRKSYYPLVTQQAYAYSVTALGILLGYYQVLFREIKLEEFPDDIAEYDSCIKDGKISAAHIRFIAIDKQYHHNRIGTSILRTIIKDVREFSRSWPIRVITIDARAELVKWYKNEGFKEMIMNTPGQEGTSVAMYFDCMNFHEELESYLEDCC